MSTGGRTLGGMTSLETIGSVFLREGWGLPVPPAAASATQEWGRHLVPIRTAFGCSECHQIKSIRDRIWPGEQGLAHCVSNPVA